MECVKIRRLLLFLFVVISCVKLSCCVENNSSSAEVLSYNDDDSEQEFSSQLLDINSRSGGWSHWSEWSSCSRSCDGGVAHQFRTCNMATCRGEHMRYKICNMQPCPEARDFREDQCSAFNEKPYKDTLYKWFAHYDEDDACALVCKGKRMKSVHLDDNTEDPVLIIARMEDKVHDGTRCRLGSLDMCIDGKCQIVGCDLKLGSSKQVDACGVCGGDGTSCARPLYHWTLIPMSLCSATCGGGYKMSRAICQNRITGDEVDEQLCNDSQKPDPSVIPCNNHNCPPRWHSGEWGSCTVTCGGGSRLRQVYCVEEANNTKIRVNEMKCFGLKPRFQEPCNQFECPTWRSSTWSGCSVSCGEGVQVRLVECRDDKEELSKKCDPLLKPTDTKPCSTGIQCQFNIDFNEEFSVLPYHQPLIQPYPPPPLPEKLVGDPIVPSETTFVPDQWGPCSVTCGDGIRKREVHCKIFLEFSRTIAKLPDHNCGTPKPIEIEKCYMGPCNEDKIEISVDAIKDDPYSRDIKVAPGTPGKTYSWKEQGYTHCSATCLGGMQELIVNCIRDDTGKVTSPYLCPIETKPEILKRICNDHPCPPKWNYSDFSPCTQSCGIGLQTREVNCIHEVTQGGRNTIIVPNNNCPQPPPPDRQYCNVLDCPVKWVVTEWSRCSKSCDGGEKTRRVECKQTMAQNHTVSRPSNMCPSPKPSEKKPCNTKSCVVESDKPKIFASNNTFIQHNVKQKKISLTVGGAATIFLGTTVKIKCPVKRFDRTKITWLKDKTPLPKSKKFKTSKKGALRIQNLSMRESGSYTCIAGKSSASIQISVRPKPGEFPTSEEIQKPGYKHQGDITADLGGHRDGMIYSEDQSHEQRPDGHMKKSNKEVLFTPTLPSLTIGDPLKALPPQSTSTHNNNNNKNQLLWPFQMFGNSRGHRMISSSEDYLPRDIYNGDQHFRSVVIDDNRHSEEVILGRGAENLRFEWESEEWSKCSEICNGVQSRVARCVVKLNNVTEEVTVSLCEDANLKRPDTFRKCNREECPQWRMEEEWSDCKKSECSGKNKISQNQEDLLPQDVANADQLFRGGSVEGEDLGRRQTLDRKMKNMKFKWKLGEWSTCSERCGFNGIQTRIAKCVVKMDNVTEELQHSLCEDADLTTPDTLRKCNREACPRWKVEGWSDCRKSKCFGLHKALQRRVVKCYSANDTVLGPSKCDKKQKPAQQQECYSERCVGKWKAGTWSECAAGCDMHGVKYRILQCVWFGTKKPAGTACKDIPRPPVMKPCVGPPCSNTDCKDHSVFCPNVKAMSMCKVSWYTQQCCESCKN